LGSYRKVSIEHNVFLERPIPSRNHSVYYYIVVFFRACSAERHWLQTVKSLTANSYCPMEPYRVRTPFKQGSAGDPRGPGAVIRSRDENIISFDNLPVRMNNSYFVDRYWRVNDKMQH